MTQILFATRNEGKKRELRVLLEPAPYEFVFLDEVGIGSTLEEDRIETGATFEENARLKAEYFQKRSGMPTVAEDSGLEVFALNGRPGVRSRRFAMPSENQDQANNTELLRQLSGAPVKRRSARYRCALVLIVGRASIPQSFLGMCRGHILEAAQGTGGFGYDPLFYSADLKKPFSEASMEEKNQVSHRAHAVQSMIEWLMTNNI